MVHPRDRNEEWQVYALSAGSLPLRVRVAGRGIRIFRVGPIAVFAGAPYEVPVEQALQDQHAIVVELARRFDPILPVRFGAQLTEARIAQVVHPSVQLLTSALTLVRGRQQLTIRLIGPAMPALTPPSSGAEYLARRRAAQAFPVDALPLRDAVGRFIVEERTQPGRGGVRLTVFHLVDRTDVKEYVKAAKSASGEIGAWRMSLSGPWPPFAFAPELPQ